MKKIYAKKFTTYKNIKQFALLAFVLMATGFYSYGQTPEKVPFSSRANFSVQGDFTLIGNTNLTPDNSGGANDSGEMNYTDVDGDPNTLNSSSATLQLTLDDKTTIADCSNILYAGLYWSGRPGPTNEVVVDGKTLYKNRILLNGPNASGYTEIQAAPNDIFYPEGTEGNMFVAFADVTDYVKQYGAGNYTAADIALLEGIESANATSSEGIGYYGSWSMVVVYENANMQMRNIGVFDGYNYQAHSSDPDYVQLGYINLDISHLNTSQDLVEAQIGVMAVEGDEDLEPDWLAIQRGNSGGYVHRLTQNSNSNGRNFFRSLIDVDAPRNPDTYNLGLDISKFDLPGNTGTLPGIELGQSQLTFQHQAVQDKFVIYNITMSFEAPGPDIEAEVDLTAINNTPSNTDVTSVLPGQDLTYKVDIKNFGTENSQNSVLSIPVPYNTTFNSVSFNTYAPYASNSNPVYNADTHTIEWNLGNLPVPTRADDLLADITFTVTATTECSILAVDCADSIALNGNITGTSSSSGTSFDKTLITGYGDVDGCAGTPIPAPIFTTLDAEDYVNANCADVDPVQNFYYCGSTSTSIPVSDISPSFPAGSRFYNQFPVTASSTEYTTSNPFPATSGSTTYYAVPPGTGTCAFEFVINVDAIDSTPTVAADPLDYCLNETAAPLTATPSDPSLTLFYYTDNDPATAPQASITPSTDVPGTFTYYVAEGLSADCIGNNRAPITVIVNDLLDVTSTITDSSCAPGTDGSIDLTVTGGSGNYTFLWNTGATTEDITGLMPGTYTVTITDADTGCDTVSSFEVSTNPDSFPTLTAPAAYATEGCDASAITDLVVSTTPVNITLDQLEASEAGGGTAAGFSALTYTDVITGSCPTIINRTFSAINDCGNETTATQTITIEDTIAPVVPIAPADVTVECSDDLPPMVDLTATDNCPSNPNIIATGVDTTDSTDPCNVIVTRTWTFTDACGNTSDVSQIITVTDTTAPVIDETHVSDTTFNCNGKAKVDVLEAWLTIHAGATATDNCSDSADIVWTNDYDYAEESPCATEFKDVTFTATDACGNSSQFTSRFKYEDSTAPVFITEAEDAQFECGDDQGLQTWLDTNGGASATDECSAAVTWSNDFNGLTDLACGTTGSAVVSFTAFDDCGNPAITTATVSIVDTTAPIAPSAPADLTVECLEDIPAPGNLTATDTCSGEINATGVDTTTDNSDPCNIVITRTWTFADDCGNTSITEQTINVIDTTAPVAPADLAPVTVECITDLPAPTDLVATDNCGDIISGVVEDVTNDSDTCNIMVTRTWTFTDNCGNSSTTQQIINVIDTTAPTAPAAPADITASCITDLPAPVELTATDNCGALITATGVDNIISEDSCNQTVIRTWTFTDDCGNTSEVSQTISVNDDVAPTLTYEADSIVYECDGEQRNPTIDAWVAINGGALAVDNCSEVTWTNNYEPNFVSCNGPVEVIFTATDDCGNSVSTAATYTIIDETAPEITTEAQDFAAECGSSNSQDLQDWLNSNGGATAEDVCAGTDITWENNFNPSDLDSGNDVTVTFTAFDTCGNSSSTTATITITDTTAPVAPAAPADVTVECSDIPAMIDLTATDNCDGDITATGVDSRDDSDPCSIIITRTWTFTDSSGNSSETSQIITAIDTTAPVVPTIPADVTIECTDPLPPMESLTATDDCGIDVTANPTDVRDETDPCNITVTRTWTFTDDCGNTSTGAQVITIIDNTAPQLIYDAEDITYNCDGEQRNPTIDAWVAINGGALASDDCSDVTWTNNYDPNVEVCNGAIEVTFVATDACGNAVETTASYTIIDENGPEIDTAPQDLVYECDTDASTTINDWLNNNGGATASDLCSDTVTWSNDFDASSITTDACGPDNGVIVTFTATDGCGNETNVSSSIIIIDNTAPVAPAAPADVTVECYDDMPANVELTATDECSGEITVTGVDTEDNSGNVLVVTRTWTFTDTCGNYSEVSQVITVEDTTAPVVDPNTAPTDLTVACITDVPDMAPLTATDNCDGAITSEGSQTINDTDACNVVITRTWTFSDASGNESDYTQIISVIDDVAPVATAPADLDVQCTDDVPAMIDLTATDNCGGDITSTGVDVETIIDSCSRIIERSWTFVDNCNNETTVTQIITVADTTAPTLVSDLDTDITVNCTALPDVPSLDFTDNCSSTVDVVYTEENTSTGEAYQNYQVIREWTVSDSCDNTNVFTQTINVNVQQEPVLVSDSRCTEGGAIDLNTYLANPDDSGNWVVVSGDATLNGSIFNPIDAAIGDYVFTFTEDHGCENQTTVTISVNEDCVAPTCDPIISSSVTPNGDQWNEYFTVTGLDRCGFVIELEIYNRWGAMVYKSEDYQNNWSGKTDKSTFGNADHLPTGTYYYIIKFKNSGLKPLTGPIYLGTK